MGLIWLKIMILGKIALFLAKFLNDSNEEVDFQLGDAVGRL